MSGRLFIIAAASGAGKTTLVHELCRSVPQLEVSISCTTRPARPGEREGVDYFFMNDATFAHLAAEQKFLEQELVFGYRYGTPREWVEDKLRAGIDVILEIDWQGARAIRAKRPETLSIFILPPSFAALEERLHGRGQDQPETIQRRMQDALKELAHYGDFDYLVINDVLETAVAEVRAIILACRQGQRPRTPDYRDVAEHLLREGRDLGY